MVNSRVRGFDQEVLGIFKKSFTKRYEQWKRKDLLAIALLTMPKQVKTESLLDNLIKLRTESAKRLSEEEQDNITHL